MAKYHNKKLVYDGMLFDSKKELKRWKELCLLEQEGTIQNLQRQVKFVLIPAQREPDKVGKRGGIIKGRLLERECAYLADFTYFDKASDKKVVEDTKGFKTADYIIKRKLMLHVYGIRIHEI